MLQSSEHQNDQAQEQLLPLGNLFHEHMTIIMVHTRDVRYTGTVKLPVSIIFILYYISNGTIFTIRFFFYSWFRSSHVGGSASQIAAHLVNVITEQVNNTMDQTD